MPIPDPTRSVSVSLVAVPAVSAAILYSLNEMFNCVGIVWESMTGQRSDVCSMTPRIVARTTDPVTASFDINILPSHSFDEEHGSDVVIVSNLDMKDLVAPVGRWKEETKWIRDQYERGAIVCSVCTGSVLLAEAGLLDKHEATTHWSAAGIFREFYPDVLLKPDRILVPTGLEHRIVTSGGPSSWTDLALYLIARFCGEEEARRIAKIFLIGDRSEGQLPFAAMVRPKQHSDAVIAQSQIWIADNYAFANPVSRMARQSGLADRTFKRRFEKATGYAPLDYVQSLRIEEAKQMLETTSDAIEEIAINVGYEEPSSFRRLFKRITGITPQKYRVRFQTVASGVR
ncbi:helix-turn-helix domain-containing protein [Parasphingorhabdus sp.]|uniref:GlxA family transcriptional regulator n=1 Tax=Parasphingorhabdus sp. TaxID=2709688 RepID=UPI0032640D9A